MVSGKNVTGFTNTLEQDVALAEVVPFLVEDMRVANGGTYQKGDDWATFVVIAKFAAHPHHTNA